MQNRKPLTEIYTEALSAGKNGLVAINHAMEVEQRDINEQDNDGHTLMHVFVILLDRYFGDYADYRLLHLMDDLDYLMALGASPDIKNRYNETVFDLLFSTDVTINSFDKTTLVPQLIALLQKYPQHTPAIMSILKNCEKIDPTFESFEKISEQINVEHLPTPCLESMLAWIKSKCNDGYADQLKVLRAKLHTQQLENEITEPARKFLQERYDQYQKKDSVVRQGLFAELLKKYKRVEVENVHTLPAPFQLKN